MTRLARDSWDLEKHQGLKRWERGAQRSAWKRREKESAAPPLPCPWREPGEEGIRLRPARVLALFQGDLLLAKYSPDSGPDPGVRLVRGGIPWTHWHHFLLRAWLRGAPVPDPFRPLRRLPPDWLEKALRSGAAPQRAFFDRLRETGLLPALGKISPEGVAPWLRWDEVRARFLDFGKAQP